MRENQIEIAANNELEDLNIIELIMKWVENVNNQILKISRN